MSAAARPADIPGLGEAPAGVAARPAALPDALVMTGRSMRVLARTPAAVLSATFMPLILMLVMTAGFAKVVAPDTGYGDYVSRVLPLFVVMGMTYGALSTGVAAHRDLNSGMDARLRTLPMARSAPLIGRITADAARNLVSITVLALVAAVIGFRLRAGIPAALAAVALALAFGSAFAWLAVAAAVRARSAEAVASALNALLLCLSFLSTGFVPAEALPGWAQPIARHSPVSAAVDAMRALTEGGPTAGPVLRTLAWTAALTAVFAPLAIRHDRTRP